MRMIIIFVTFCLNKRKVIKKEKVKFNLIQLNAKKKKELKSKQTMKNNTINEI